MPDLNLKEGMTLSDAVTEAEKVLQTNRVIIIKAPDKSTCEGVKIGGVKIFFPKNLRDTKDNLKMPILAGMKLKEMTMYNGERAFFLIPDLTIIKEGIHLKELYERPEFDIKYIKERETAIVKGINISNINIWFPENYRRIVGELDLNSLQEMPLKKYLEMENKFFLRPPRPELIPDNNINKGQTLKDFLENKDFKYIFDPHHGTIKGVRVEGVPIYFPRSFQVDQRDLNREALGAMRIKRSTIIELAYFLEP